MALPRMRPISLKSERVDMSHGAGGRSMAQLIHQLFAKHLGNPYLAQGDDGARMPRLDGPLVMATDAHVVSPLFFPGGDIGSLAVHGTVNDVAVMGARPRYLAAAFVLEEGFPLADLARIVESMAAAAREAGVAVVTGDTKVVEAGKGDGVFITTTGVGELIDGVQVSGAHAQPGDAVLVSGPIGDHGMAIMAVREDLGLDTPIVSDSAALHGLIADLLAAVPEVHVLRDPTRGGLSATLNEISHQSEVGIVLNEAAIPVRREVAAACELLGLDPLDIACEGRVIVICPGARAEAALSALRGHPLGAQAAVIGEVIEDERGFVQMATSFGGRRMVDWLAGESLPRIC
ncbi:MAG: hydrogenase expression/formation protein HypE [Austwickia sp.]|nr:hydrogenase expression/formation protein HypE [Austwickia sp.]MBK8435074.1 hydrogenase expression/formation protein HypE [Austwickia sp.]MBK9101371.1 hydrogenase expression/formation protein HypE [Austwickia sp.]